MEFKLDDSHKSYIKITVSGALVKKRIVHAMKALITHPEYEVKHSLWDLTGAEQGTIDIHDIKEIIGFLRLYKPKQRNFANKGAFLVSTDMNKALVNVYVTLSKMLPFKYKVYTRFENAVAYLSGK